MSLAMSVAERQTFLAGVHIGVLGITDGQERGPWLVPIWYGYEPGGLIRIITGAESRKMPALRRAGRCSLCVQTEDPPYRYVTAEGPVVAIEHPVDEDERRSLAHRYLGADAGEAYLAATVDLAAGEVVVSLRPERWLSADFAKQQFG